MHTRAYTHTHTHTKESDRATSTRCILGNANAGGSVIFKPHNLRFT